METNDQSINLTNTELRILIAIIKQSNPTKPEIQLFYFTSRAKRIYAIKFFLCFN